MATDKNDETATNLSILRKRLTTQYEKAKSWRLKREELTYLLGPISNAIKNRFLAMEESIETQLGNLEHKEAQGVDEVIRGITTPLEKEINEYNSFASKTFSSDFGKRFADKKGKKNNTEINAFYADIKKTVKSTSENIALFKNVKALFEAGNFTSEANEWNESSMGAIDAMNAMDKPDEAASKSLAESFSPLLEKQKEDLDSLSKSIEARLENLKTASLTKEVYFEIIGKLNEEIKTFTTPILDQHKKFLDEKLKSQNFNFYLINARFEKIKHNLPASRLETFESNKKIIERWGETIDLNLEQMKKTDISLKEYIELAKENVTLANNYENFIINQESWLERELSKQVQSLNENIQNTFDLMAKKVFQVSNALMEEISHLEVDIKQNLLNFENNEISIDEFIENYLEHEKSFKNLNSAITKDQVQSEELSAEQNTASATSTPSAPSATDAQSIPKTPSMPSMPVQFTVQESTVQEPTLTPASGRSLTPVSPTGSDASVSSEVSSEASSTSNSPISLSSSPTPQTFLPSYTIGKDLNKPETKKAKATHKKRSKSSDNLTVENLNNENDEPKSKANKSSQKRQTK